LSDLLIFEERRPNNKNSFPHCSGKNMEQSAARSDVIDNIVVIVQIPTENLFVLIIIS